MKEALDINKAEKKTMRVAIFDDGLWDMFLGVVLLTLSLYGWMRSQWPPAVAAVVLMSVLIVFAFAYRRIKARLKETRAGKVKFAARSKRKLGMFKILMTLLVLLSATLALVFMTGWIRIPAWFPALGVDILFAVVAGGVFMLMGAFFGISRLYAYGVLFGMALISTPLVESRTELPVNPGFTITGLFVLTVGILSLRRFWQLTHPAQSKRTAVDEI